MIPRELIYKQWVINYIEYLERKCDIKQWNWAWYMKLILSDVKNAVSSMKTREDRVKEAIEKKLNECTHWTWPDSLYQLAILQELLNELYPNNL